MIGKGSKTSVVEKTLFFELVAEAHPSRGLVSSVPRLINVIILDCFWLLDTGGGNSLMIHNTKAEGTKEPTEEIKEQINTIYVSKQFREHVHQKAVQTTHAQYRRM